jgi:adenylate kinase
MHRPSEFPRHTLMPVEPIKTLAEPPAAPAPTARITDLEIKDAQLIFGAVWQKLEADFGREQPALPQGDHPLGGAPGAGKGTNTAFIAKAGASPAARS